MYALKVENLSKYYGSKKDPQKVLNNVSFEVKKGEIFGLLGPNGAGKTTLINILTGILTSDEGNVSYFGKPLCEEIKNKINAATAYNALNGIMTVMQNLKVYAKIYNVKNAEEKIISLLKIFEISELKDSRVYNISAGQKTRVNICKALINDPELIFLDEATSGLDPHIASIVKKEIKNLNSTIIFTSHIMSEVEELCDRILFLNKGEVLKLSTPKELKELIKNDEFIVEFISKPKNFSVILKKLGAKKFGESYQITIKKNLDSIMKELVCAGFEIANLHIKKPSLDDLFVKVARNEIL